MLVAPLRPMKKQGAALLRHLARFDVSVGLIPQPKIAHRARLRNSPELRGWSARGSNPELRGVSSRQSTPSKRPSAYQSLVRVAPTSVLASSHNPRKCGQLRAQTQPKIAKARVEQTAV